MNIRIKIQDVFSWYTNIIDTKPYRHSFFLISIFFLLLLLSYEKSDVSLKIDWSNNFDFVNVQVQDQTEVEKEQPKKELDENQFQTTDSEEQWAAAVDMAFQLDNKFPRLLYPLKKIYPKYPKDKEVEATVLVEILIQKDGIVRDLKVKGVQLSKFTSLEDEQLFKVLFIAATKQMLLVARYTAPIIDKKNTAIRMEFPLIFRLKD